MKHTATLAACVLLALACQRSEDRPAPAGSEADVDLTDLIQYEPTAADARDVYATGACTDGETRACRVYLPSHNDVQPCFVGEQTCASSRWGECESGSVVDANDDDAELDPSDLPE
ncbi:MAG TPA: hypothetical protein VMG12_17325 [Polyangiaceae bacterium]|nr:hypothetical protein [Polyangiaceae bacterium]